MTMLDSLRKLTSTIKTQKLSLSIGLSGWVIVSFYLLYLYSIMGSVGELYSFLTGAPPVLMLFHLMIFLAPVLSTDFAYLVSKKTELEVEFDTVLESSSDAIITTDAKGKITYFSRAAEEMVGYRTGEMADRSFTSLFPSKSKWEGAKILGRSYMEPVRNERAMFIKRDGEPVDVELSLSPLRDEQGDTFGSICIARDVSEEVIEERVGELIETVNHLINSGAEEREVFDAITWGLTSWIGYKLSAIYLLSEDRKELVCVSYSFDPEKVRKLEKLAGIKALGYRVPLFEGSILRQVVETKEPAITDDIEELIKCHTTDERLRKLAPRLAKLLGINFGIGVPLLSGDKLVGTIGVGSEELLMEKDAERLARFGRQAGLAVERAMLYEDLEDYAKELEESEEKYSTIVEEGNDWIVIIQDGIIIV